MKRAQKKWATLDECAHALASAPGALPKHSIEQELVAAVRSGRLPARRNGLKIKYPAKGLYSVTGGILDLYTVEVETQAVLALVGAVESKRVPRKGGRPEREGTIARSEIQALYPTGVPKEMKNMTLADEVQASLKAKNAKTIPGARTIAKARAKLDAQ